MQVNSWKNNKRKTVSHMICSFQMMNQARSPSTHSLIQSTIMKKICTSHETKMTFSKAEVREMVKTEVQNAKKQSHAQLDGLLETIQQLSNDTHYERAVGQLEIQIEKLKRRADAAIDHVMKLDANSSQDTPQLKIPRPSTAGTAKSKVSRSDLGDDSALTASHSKHSSVNTGDTAVKDNRKLLQAMEATRSTMIMMQANNEALKSIRDDFKEETSTPCEGHKFDEMHAVPIEEWDRMLAVVKEEPQEQPICMNIETEPLDQDESSSHKHPEQKASVYPPLPDRPFPSILNMEAASYNIPSRLGLKLALIRKPPGLSVLWNVEEEDPSAPPMDSYSVYMSVEKEKGGGVFPEWITLGEVNAIPLPMCIMIVKFKPGFKTCFVVVGKDVFGRYGPYSEIVHVVVPNQIKSLP
ncbi:hypothetical protein CRUP_012594 [Coryphaenoides rupestris]|nr:hypothetical protein CRUP_012594 [Coryphaenoides rupestris]